MKKLLPIFCHNLSIYSQAAKDGGFNKTKIAAKAHMSKGQFSDLCNGKISHPGIWTAKRLADALGISVDDLITTNPGRRSVLKIEIERRFFDKSMAALSNLT